MRSLTLAALAALALAGCAGQGIELPTPWGVLQTEPAEVPDAGPDSPIEQAQERVDVKARRRERRVGENARVGAVRRETADAGRRVAVLLLRHL